MAEPHAAAHATQRISEATLALFPQIDIAATLAALAPEIVLTAAAIIIVLVDLFLKKRQSYVTGLLALLGAGLALLTVLAQGGSAFTGEPILFGTYQADGLTAFFRGFFILALLFTVVISQMNNQLDEYRPGEYYGVLFVAAISMCMLAAAGNIVLFILAFETLSLMSYVLVGYAKGTRNSVEGSLKYLLFGALASGVMFYGLSFFYGLGGTADLPLAITNAFSSQHPYVALTALLLVMAGIGFKISMVPFHFWAPDAYQSAPLPVGAFLSVASKGAGFAALVRIVWPIAGLDAAGASGAASIEVVKASLPYIFGVLALLTMTLGNLAALRQTEFRRLFAYSSIAHAGYMLLAFTNMSQATLAGLLGYLGIYLFMNLAAFAIVQLLENDRGTTEISEFRGYFRANPFAVTCLVMVLVSLVGLPPMAGFMAKFLLFYGVIGSDSGVLAPWQVILVVAAVLNTAVSLYYYIYPAKVMIIEQPADEAGRARLEASAAALSLPRWTLSFITLFLLVAPLVYFFLRWPLVNGLLRQATVAWATL